MAIKIDLEKAYDRLGWDFIRNALKLFKFPEHLSSIILSCISSSSVSVLYNGGSLDPFHPSRGIRVTLQEESDKETHSLFIFLFYVWKS